MVQTPKWEIFEESFHVLRTFENPFAEVELQAVFEGSGARYTVDGFYDGDDVWRVRFSPMHEGVWRYTTHSNIAELDSLTGSFECVKAVSRGPLCLSPERRRSPADPERRLVPPYGQRARAALRGPGVSAALRKGL